MVDLSRLAAELSNAFGPSGFEGEVRDVFRNWLTGRAEITYDNLGGIMAWRRGASETPKILLAAHLDEVGLLVRGILPGGCLRAVPLGGWWPPTLLAQRVVVRSAGGDHFGIIGAKPPHFLGEDEKNRPLRWGDLYIDVGATSAAEVADLGIAVGDPVVPAVAASPLGLAGTIVGKAFDNRIGCAAVIATLLELRGDHPNLVIGSGTVQEENGARGARTLASLVQPDLCLVLEGPPADDFPDAGAIVQGKMGGGPQIRFYDPSMIANQALAKLAVAQAQRLGLPYQVTVRESGGTDGSAIQVQTVGGVPTLVIGIPVRYAHSPQSIVRLSDLEATIQLVGALLGVLDEATVDRLKQQPW
ncbi:putative aminopeptidase FrvX [Hydrogenispora ethanolica]|uniref:Putative aminopeptidase FrvX n=1 Tax=Hydrogenispora ethanolica TaxID=1082276 RepID=A0A4R1S4N2_HYDET|nr:M42 family metallopeptidase [Hydrogenispora ethanolica]TCL74171.1 putative aminopeptidase FrvX [Hydrogenispora ethanolica]